MIPFRILNNATTNFIKGMPQKELTSSNQNDFSMTRKEYAKTVNIEPTKKWFGTSSNRDASQIIANRKKNSVGVGSLNANKELMSFTKPNNQLDIFQTKQRVRNGGYTVPPKVQNNNSSNIGNTIFPSQIINTELVVDAEIEDVTPPVVTLNGNASITIEKGATYTEQGATSDGDEIVNISGTVDVNTVGTYTITYSATDAAGNTGTATRTVEVVEPIVIPVINPIETSAFSWGAVLSADEKIYDGSVNVVTQNVEDGQVLTLTLVKPDDTTQDYSQPVISNTALVIIPTSDLQSLIPGQQYKFVANVSNQAGVLADPKESVVFEVQ